jgi:hypothetical protein
VTDGEWSQTIELDGMKFEAEFIQRPFREGIEVRIKTSQGIVRIAELGLGERALVEKARSLIRSRGLTPPAD